MPDLTEAIHLIEKQVAVIKARCVIADEGFPDESSMFGTRDGYLNLALALLRFVATSDAGGYSVKEGGQWDSGGQWDDGVKATLYQLPTRSATLQDGRRRYEK